LNSAEQASAALRSGNVSMSAFLHSMVDSQRRL